MRMARYDVQNEGVGPFAVFFCDKCGRDFRTDPAISTSDVSNLGRSVLGGLLRAIPVVGYSVADNMQDPRTLSTLTADQLQTAWGQVEHVFHECPTCLMIVCPTDFDAASGYCTEHIPRAPRRRKGGGATTPAGRDSAAAPAGRTCPQCQAAVPEGMAFCTNCGTRMPPPAPAAIRCPNCGTMVAGHFCGNCGTRVG